MDNIVVIIVSTLGQREYFLNIYLLLKRKLKLRELSLWETDPVTVPQQRAKLWKSVIFCSSKELVKSSTLYHECNSKCIRRSKNTARSAFLALQAPREGRNQQEYSSFHKKKPSTKCSKNKNFLILKVPRWRAGRNKLT